MNQNTSPYLSLFTFSLYIRFFFSYYVAFLFFSILHEIGHYLVALYFSFEIEKIMILPFGAFLSLKDLGKHYVYEEIGMLFCGPFINLICFIFFSFLIKRTIVS